MTPMGKYPTAAALLVAFVLSPGEETARAAKPWEKLLPFKKIDADPEKSYRVTDSNGPWMILATVFRGDNAEQKAHELVLELRKTYKLPAFVHEKVFDYTHQVRGRGFNPDGTPKVMKHAQGEQVKEVAVMVGNYASVDDPDAANTLKKIKTLEPESLKRGAQSQVFADLRNSAFAKKRKGPMGSAFVAPNPLLPPEYFNTSGVDKLVLEMNKQVPHSLLDCPGKYSVRVATFTGNAVIDQRKIKNGAGVELKSRLEQAAEKAHLLTEELRARGEEAYEFHDRTQSIVTVGSFESLEMPTEDGRKTPNPQISRVINAYRPQVATAPGVELSAKQLVNVKERFTGSTITLDLQPAPVPAPKRSIGAVYQR